MKRTDLMKQLQTIAADKGKDLNQREGGSHTIIRIGQQSISVPRHREINENTARKIIQTAKEA